jgi:dTDP-glucose 4,6-dehydratase
MDSNKTSILLTGASGFAGAHMLKFLIQNTDSFIYCPVTYEHGGHRNRIPSLVSAEFKDRFELFELDLAKDSLVNSFDDSNLRLIINFASESHVDRSITDPAHFVSNNVNLMTNILEFTRNHLNQVQFIHVSTDEVYGAIDAESENVEWNKPYLPSNPYSASKAAQESLSIAYTKTFGLDLTIVNVTNMIGESQNQEKFIPKVIRKLIAGELINVDTDPRGIIGSRKYVYVGDVAEAVYLIYAKMKENDNKLSSLPNKFHISGEQDFTNLQIVNLIAEFLGKDANIQVSESPRPGYDLKYVLSSEKIRSMGWKNKYTIEQRLSQIVAWTLENDEWMLNDHSKAK